MRKISICIVALVLFSAVGVQGAAFDPAVRVTQGESSAPLTVDESEWFAFGINYNKNDQNIVNVSHITNDAPAGKHGFITVSDGHLSYQSGERVRFWGINLSRRACFPSSEDAEKLAEHFAKSGINLVRLMNMDGSFAPNGIFKDNVEKNTLTLDPEQLERLDYFVYCLKQRGIYIGIPLYVARPWSASDGIPDPEIPKSGKYVSFLDEKFLELQQDYAEKLLTHLNPYTNLTYAQEPALASIEIANENSMISGYRYNNNPLFPGSKHGTRIDSEYYLQELDDLFNEFLREKYQATASLATAWAAGGGKKGLESGESLESGTVERTKISDASSYSAQRIRDNVEFYQWIEMRYYSAMMEFLKNELGVRVPITTTNNWFGLPGLAAQSRGDYIDAHGYWDHPTDFPAGELYPDGQSASSTQYRQENTSMISQYSYIGEGDTPSPSTGNPFVRHVGSAIAGKPMVVSEWNHVFPNDYEYEGLPFIAAYESLQDFDGAYLFNYYNDNRDLEKESVQYSFGSNGNQIKLAFMPACSIAYIRGDISPAVRELVLSYNQDFISDNFKDNGNKIMYATKDGELPLALAYRHRVRRGSFDEADTTSSAEAIAQEEINNLTQDGKIVSDTSELILHLGEQGREFVTVNTPKTQGAFGFVAGKRIELNNLVLDLSTDSSVMLTSMEDLPIGKSESILLTAGARQKNTNQEKEPIYNSLTQLGDSPMLLEPVLGEVGIKLEGTNCRAYALDDAGNRKSELEVTWIDGYASFTLGDNQTVWYEITQERPTIYGRPRIYLLDAKEAKKWAE